MKNIDFKLPYSRSENCLIINARDWVRADGGSLLTKDKVTNIQEVKGVGYTSCFNDYEVDVGDKVILTRAAANIAYLRPYEIPDIEGKFANVHWMQVIGKFVGNIMDKEHVQLFYSKVMLEKVESTQDLFGDGKGLYKILAVGGHGFNEDWEPDEITGGLGVGIYCTVEDSTVTCINLNGEDLYFADREYIVQVSDNLTDWHITDDKILLASYQDEMSGSLYNPLVDLSVDDISEVYNRDKFSFVDVGYKFRNRYKVGDIVCVGRDYLTPLNVNGYGFFYTRSDEYMKGIYK